REALRALDPSRASAWAKDGDPRVPELIREARHERRLRADDNEVDLMLAAEPEQPLAVLGPNGMTRADLGDSGVSRRRVQLVAVFALGQFPGKRVLAPARPHDQDLPAPSVSKGSVARILFSWSDPVSIATSGRRSGKVSSPCSSIRRRRPCRRRIASSSAC